MSPCKNLNFLDDCTFLLHCIHWQSIKWNKNEFPFLHICTHWSPTHLQQKASIKTSAKSCVNNSSKKSTQKDDADVIIESGIQIKLWAGKQIIFCFRKHFFALTYGSFWKLVENKIIYYLKLLIRALFLKHTVQNTD